MRDSTRYTDCGYAVIDISNEVEEFIYAIDNMVDDLGYDLDAILRMHPRFRRRSDNSFNEMTNDLLEFHAVKVYDDAHLIAVVAITDLFPKIDAIMKDHGYSVCGIKQIKLKQSARQRIHCHALLAVI